MVLDEQKNTRSGKRFGDPINSGINKKKVCLVLDKQKNTLNKQQQLKFLLDLVCDWKKAVQLIENNPNLLTSTYDGITALGQMVISDADDCVESTAKIFAKLDWLLEQGLDINERQGDNSTLLHCCKSLGMMIYLINKE